MPNAKTKPIHYGEAAQSALAACKTYLEEAESYVKGKRSKLPNPTPLLTARFPSSTILPAVAVDATQDLDWPTIKAPIEDKVAEKPRLFDPWYFVVMLLLELPGGRFIYHRSKMAQYFYAAYAGPNKSQNFYLRRIVVDTPIWADTREGKHSNDAHFDYRRATLHWEFKDVIRTLGQKTRSVSSNRADAVGYARDLFRQQVAAHSPGRTNAKTKLPGIGLTADDYAKLLSIGLHLADAMHEKHLIHRSRRSKKDTSKE